MEIYKAVDEIVKIANTKNPKKFIILALMRFFADIVSKLLPLNFINKIVKYKLK